MRTVLLNYAYNWLTWLSQGVNMAVFLGDPDESCSGRIGKSILRQGWAARVPWPAFLREHFLASVEWDRGGDSAFTRKERV